MVSWRQPAIVAIVAAATMFTALGRPHLWDRDEPRNARCAVEMLERGDWIVPTFNGELRAHKPALLYWLMMTAYEVFGPTEFAARFWSALLGVGTVLATYRLGYVLFNARAGFWSGLAMATNLNFLVAARAATPDSALIFFTTLAIYFLIAAFIRRDVEGNHVAQLSPMVYSPWRLAAGYACMGLAVLTKGPIGVVLPLGTIGLILLYATQVDVGERPAEPKSTRFLAKLLAPLRPSHVLRCALALRPVWLVGIVLAVAAPWYIAVHLETGGAWTEEFFLQHNIGRAASPMENHDGPVFYYIIALLVGFFPWSVLAAPMVIEVGRNLRIGPTNRLGYLTIVCWTVWCVGLFSLVGTKLPSYILPAYPAVALACGAFFDRWLWQIQAAADWWMTVVFAVLATVGLGLVIGLPIAASQFLPGEEWLAVIGMIPLVAGVIGIIFVRREQRGAASAVMAVGATALAVVVFGPAIARVDGYQISHAMTADIAAQSPERPEILAFKNLEPSVVYYAQTEIPIHWTERGVAAAFRRAARPVLLIHDEDWPAVRSVLPPDAQVLAQYQRFLKPGRILVVGRGAWTERTAANPGFIKQ
jgi:4-amino-4-deoxy-L-arabinose transferase-like glycosyltransferase